METIKAGIRSRAQGNPLLNATATVVAVVSLTPQFTRLTLASEDLAEYVPHPADGFKLMLPPPGEAAASLPSRGADGVPAWEEGAVQPVLRALTVRSYDPQSRTLVADVLRHDTGVLTHWLDDLSPGQRVDLAGMRPEWHLPAAASIIEDLPGSTAVALYLIASDARMADLVPTHPRLKLYRVADHNEVPRCAPASVLGGRRTQVWIAAEASAVRELRRHAVDIWRVGPGDMLARAYWKAGSSATDVDSENLVRYQQAIARGEDLHDPALAEAIDLHE